MNYEKLKELNLEEFKRFTGVDMATFQDMVKVVKAEILITKKSGRKSKLSIEEQILLTLAYFREYRTYFHLAKEVGLNESNVCRTIQKIEKILISSGIFQLPGKKALKSKDINDEYEEEIVLDVTEIEIERPQKKQKASYSGKKKKHTQKAQLVVSCYSKLIICTAYAKGAVHDFTLFKESKLSIVKEIFIKAAKGYQGIKKIQENSKIPHKKPKGKTLDKEQKKENQELAKKRIIIEHINRTLKRWRILASRYRNRGKRLGLRFNLIAGIYNYELKSQIQLRENS